MSEDIVRLLVAHDIAAQGGTVGGQDPYAWASGQTAQAPENASTNTPNTVTVSDKGRGRTSYLRQSMAEKHDNPRAALNQAVKDSILGTDGAAQAIADSGQTADSYYEQANSNYAAATNYVENLNNQLSNLKEQNETSTQLKRTNVVARLFGDRLGITKDNTEEISNLEKALEQAQASQEKAEAELKSATRYKSDQDNKNQ